MLFCVYFASTVKKFAPLIIVVLLAAIYIAWVRTSPPVAIVENTSRATVKVQLETDTGERYIVGTISPGNSVRIEISGRDKAIWAAVELPDGKVRKSKQIYTTTQGTLSVRIDNNTVGISYEL